LPEYFEFGTPPSEGFLSRRPLSFLVVPQWLWCFDVLLGNDNQGTIGSQKCADDEAEF
jgi:hypothetical protein